MQACAQQPGNRGHLRSQPSLLKLLLKLRRTWEIKCPLKLFKSHVLALAWCCFWPATSPYCHPLDTLFTGHLIYSKTNFLTMLQIHDIFFSRACKSEHKILFYIYSPTWLVAWKVSSKPSIYSTLIWQLRDFTLGVVGEDEEVHTGGAGSRAKDGDSLRVSSKVANVFIEPAQGLDLVQQAIVPLRRLVPCAQKPCGAN